MTELEDKETLEILSNTRDQIVELVKKYNILARDKNQNTRMAYATASSWADEEEDDVEDELEETDDTDFYDNKIKQINAAKIEKPKRKTNYEKAVEDSYGDNVGVSISSPEAGCWFPSSICN
jgi:hypothetical protein